jgi:hypothetical protein
MTDVARDAWDALLRDDAEASPFVRWAWLEALERAGCAAPRTGWRPRHLTLWRGDALIAAAPAYGRDRSDGDFSRDWGWAESCARARVPYYPKLVVGVPFTPVNGRRVLVAPGEDRQAAVRALLDGALGLADDEGFSSLQVLFPDASEMDDLERAGLARRVDFQCHWHNAGYRNTDDWLAALSSKRRHQARREMAAPAAQGIAIRAVRGDEIARDPERWARVVDEVYRATVEKLPWGRRWLDERFLVRVFTEMPDALEIVEATRDGRVVAAAFNGRSATRLFGRTWGCVEEHPFLHFNVCLYFSIADCIARGLAVFEGGAGGEHKLHRGFDLAPTYSAHAFLDARFDRALRAALREEVAGRLSALAAWRASRRPASRAVPPEAHGAP